MEKPRLSRKRCSPLPDIDTRIDKTLNRILRCAAIDTIFATPKPWPKRGG
jgi:2-iminobutanoate/2-iminopropanoate deaminase